MISAIQYFSKTIIPDSYDDNNKSLEISILFSEAIWSIPFSDSYFYSTCRVSDSSVPNLCEADNDNIKKFRITVQLVASVILFGMTYLRPKWGLALTAATLLPKIYHRTIIESPATLHPFFPVCAKGKVTKNNGHFSPYGLIVFGNVGPNELTLIKDRLVSYLRHFNPSNNMSFSFGILEALGDLEDLVLSLQMGLIYQKDCEYRIFIKNMDFRQTVFKSGPDNWRILNPHENLDISMTKDVSVYFVPGAWNHTGIQEYIDSPDTYSGKEKVGYITLA